MIEGEILADCDVVPTAVRTPIVVSVVENLDKMSLDIVFRDGGVWTLHIRELQDAFFIDRRQQSSGHLLAEAFAADPSKFRFKRRVRLQRRTS